MKNIKQQIYLVLLLLSTLSYGQEKCKLSGRVIDSANTIPIFDVAITAYDSKDMSQGYTFSDKEGYYKLELPCKQDYELEVENLSYNSLLQKVKLEKNKKLNLILSKSKETIKEVLYKSKQPIVVKGDTIEYNTDMFKSGEEENLEDVLKKLPGLNIENGKVFYKGKEINNITVGGRQVLGGNNKLLTKNLPSNAVDKVQLKRKFKRNPFANSLDSEEEASLNIVLKEDKQNLWFGNLTLGGDSQKHYDLQSKSFFFNPKMDATIIADANTFGKEVFSREDYMKFMGGYQEFVSNGGQYSLEEKGVNIKVGSQKLAEMNAKFVATHFGYEPNKKLHVSGFTTMSANKYQYKSSLERIYQNGESFIDKNETNQDLKVLISRMALNYNPNLRNKIKYRINFNVLKEDQNEGVKTFGNTAILSERDVFNKEDNINLKQKFSWNRKVGSEDNFSLHLSHQWQNQKPELSIFSENIALDLEGISSNNTGLYQNQKFNNQDFRALAIYNHLWSNTVNLRFKLGSNYSHQIFENKLYGNSDLNAQLKGNTALDFWENYTDITISKKWNLFNLDLGTSLVNYDLKKTELSEDVKLKALKILPHIKAKYKFNEASVLNGTYNQSYLYPKLESLTKASRIENYYTLFEGNKNLEPAKYHNYSLSYSKFDAFKFFSLWTSLNYNKKENSLKSTSDFVVNSELGTLQQLRGVINSQQSEENISANIYMDKKFSRFYTLRLNGALSQNKYYTFIANKETENVLISHNYTLSNRFRFTKTKNLKLGLSYRLSDYKSLNNTSFVTWQPFLDFTTKIGENLRFKTEFNYHIQYQNKNHLNDYKNLTASLRYKITKGIKAKIEGGNLLNNKQEVQSTFNQLNNTTEINRVELLGRYLILSVQYNF